MTAQTTRTYTFASPPQVAAVAPTKIVPLATLSGAPYTYQPGVSVGVPVATASVDYDAGRGSFMSRWGMIILAVIVVILVLIIIGMIIWIVLMPSCSKCKKRRCHCPRSD